MIVGLLSQILSPGALFCLISFLDGTYVLSLFAPISRVMQFLSS